MHDPSAWLDPGVRDQLSVARMFEARTHRGCLKTHAPWDGIPFDPDCTCITVYGHPIHARLLMRRHVSGLKVDLIQGRFPDAPAASVSPVLDGAERVERADGITLESVTESMQFETMPANGRSYAAQGDQTSERLKDPGTFFNSTNSRKWQGSWWEGDLHAFHERLSVLVCEEDARRLQTGGALPAWPTLCAPKAREARFARVFQKPHVDTACGSSTSTSER